MSASRRLTEELNPVAMIPSVSGVGSYYSDAIPMDSAYGRRLLAIVNCGAIGSSGTVDFCFAWSTTAQGSYTASTAHTSTQLTQSGNTGSLINLVECSLEQVQAAHPTAKYMKGYLKTLVAATPCGVVILGGDLFSKPPASATMSGYYNATMPAQGSLA